MTRITKTVTAFSAFRIWSIALNAAQRAADEKAADPTAITTDTLTSILLSAVAFEAFINELPDQLFAIPLHTGKLLPVEPHDWRDVARTIQQFETDRLQTTIKYLEASKKMPGNPLDKGSGLFAEFSMLFDIRNDLMHTKPQVDTFPDRSRKNQKWLLFCRQKKWTYKVKGEEVPLMGWIDEIQTPEMAWWSCRASLKIILNFVDRFDGVPEHMGEMKDRMAGWNLHRSDKRLM